MLVLLVLFLALSAYISNELSHNLDYYIIAHNNIKENIIPIILLSKIKINHKTISNKTNTKRNYSSCKPDDLLSKFLTENNLKPIYMYSGLHINEARKIILLQDLVGLSGIYLIFNKVTGDYYIGSASTGRFYARFTNHLLYL